MSADDTAPSGPDLTAGVALSDIADGAMVLGHVGDEKVLIARRGAEHFAIGAVCTHYSGPLAEGLVVGDEVHCPWHHACFSLRTGEALHAPAFQPVDAWRVERSDGKLFVREKLIRTAVKESAPSPSSPRSVGIIGGGAAGFAAAEMLRRKGYASRLVMISADPDAPYDRPNLSKDYLAGNAQEDWIPLQSADFYQEHEIELILGARATRLDAAQKRIHLADGRSFAFDAILLAQGAEPIRFTGPGADLPHVHTLRTLRDSRAIIAKAAQRRRAVVVGASFIGLEVAASLRARNIEVHVVAPEARPMERILGEKVGDFIRALHESHGVVFHLGEKLAAISPTETTLESGAKLAADLVVVGIGVRPVLDLAEGAGLAIDRGVKVNEYLETSAPGIYAAGDAARWPDRASGEDLRVEHWVVAERQGQTAACNILGLRKPHIAPPFFWSQHYDVVISYVGAAKDWDEIILDGDLAALDCALRYRKNGKVLAVATIFRDQESLRAEAAMEGLSV